MSLYIKERLNLFYVGSIFAAAVSAVLYFEWGGALLAWASVGALRKASLFLIYIAPILLMYAGAYLVNRCLIRLFGGSQFSSARRRVMESLVSTAHGGQAATLHASDLVEEEAWRSLRRYWSHK